MVVIALLLNAKDRLIESALDDLFLCRLKPPSLPAFREPNMRIKGLAMVPNTLRVALQLLAFSPMALSMIKL